MLKPKRIQRSRKKGWRMPSNTVYVGRPSKWGNPFAVECDYKLHGYEGTVLDNGHAMELFEEFVSSNKQLAETIKLELKGKNLACWCAPDKPCHADVLLRIANEEGYNE